MTNFILSGGPKQFLKSLECKYFVYAVVEARRLRACACFLVERNTAHHHQLHEVRRELSTQGSRGHDAIELGHMNIQQHEVGPPALCQLYRFGAVLRAAY